GHSTIAPFNGRTKAPVAAPLAEAALSNLAAAEVRGAPSFESHPESQSRAHSGDPSRWVPPARRTESSTKGAPARAAPAKDVRMPSRPERARSGAGSRQADLTERARVP